MPSLLKLTPPSSAFNSLDFFAIFSAAYMLVFIRVFALDPLALCCLGWQFVHFHGLPGTGTLIPPELYLQRLKFSFLPAPNLQLASMYLNFFIMEAFKHKKSRDGNIMNLMSHLVPIIHAWQCFSSHLHTFWSKYRHHIFSSANVSLYFFKIQESFKINYNIYCI